MKNILTFFILLFFTSFIFAQKHKFLQTPKLADEDVKSTRSTLQTDAAAEILYNSYHYRVDYQGVMYVDVISRVKIYDKNKAGDYLDKEISIYNGGSSREKLLGLKAYTYNFENGETKATRVEKDSKFTSTEDKDYNITKFAFPDVKNGSVLEYSYQIETPYYYSMPKVMVEREIPVRYFEYILQAPTELAYSINYTGSLKPKHIDVGQKSIYGGTHNSYSYGYENVPAYKDESFVGNNNNYKTSIKPEVNSSLINNQVRRFTLTWEDVRKNLYEHRDFGGELDKSNAVKNVIPEEIKSILNRQEKADAIFKFVQANYKWDNKTSIITDKGIRNLISTRIGNSAEINLFLIMLLKDAGLEADPVVLSTVQRGALMTYLPSLHQLNYVVAGLQNGNETYLYDATSKYSSKNTLPIRALNYTGFLMTGKKAKEINIRYLDTSETILKVDAKMKSDGTFEGHFSDSDTKLYGMMVHENYDDNKEEYQKTYSEKYKFPFKNLKSGSEGDGVFETSFDFDADTFVDGIGNKLVFNPMLFLYAKKHSFDQEEERQSPLEFFSAYNKIKKVTITLPEGFEFQNVPTSKRFRTDDNEISYLYYVKQEGNKLTVETTTNVKSSTYPKEYYPAFKQIFDNITKLEGQVVTAVKK